MIDPFATTYEEEQAAIKSEQAEKKYEDVKKEMKEKNEYILELNNLAPQHHIWIDRGAVASCEGAAHPNHRAFKRLK